MEALGALEQKIKSLVDLIQELKEQNKKLSSLNEAMKKEFTEQKSECKRLVVENEQLLAKLDMVQSSMVKGNEQIEELSHEKELTKTVVDDLIKSINSLVENEQSL